MIEAITKKGMNITAEIDAFIADNTLHNNGVYPYGHKLEASITSNNAITLKDGLLVLQGRYLRVKPGTTEQLKISNGKPGITRHDLIVAHFETDGLTESYDLRVIKGLDNGELPIHKQGDLFSGATIAELPLYDVYLNGSNIEKVTQLFNYIYSIHDIFDYLSPQNLLVNGDFQINQRGKKEYSPSGFENTLDMWGITNMVLNVLPDDWIKIRNKDSAGAHGLRQSFDGKTGNHMLCLNIRNLTGKAKAIISYNDGSSQEIGDVRDGRNELKIIPTKPFTRISINLQELSSCEIEYMDLFSGDIAYPHVKEDKSLALYRCQRYYQNFSNDINRAVAQQTYTETGLTQCEFRFPVEMVGNPTVVIQKFECKDLAGHFVPNGKISTLIVNKTKASFKMVHDNQSVQPRYIYVWFSVSCEPL